MPEIFINAGNFAGENASSVEFFAHSSPEVPSANNTDHLIKQATIAKLRADRIALGTTTNNFSHSGGAYTGGSSNDLDYLRKK